MLGEVGSYMVCVGQTSALYKRGPEILEMRVTNLLLPDEGKIQ